MDFTDIKDLGGEWRFAIRFSLGRVRDSLFTPAAKLMLNQTPVITVTDKAIFPATLRGRFIQ